MRTPNFYTGIGSRETPTDVLDIMTRLARLLRTEGWTLRSGHAMGADWAFEQGAQKDSVIYLPWPDFGQAPYGNDPGRPVLGTPVADKFNWYRLHDTVLVPRQIRQPSTGKLSLKALHGRNVAQVTGYGDQSTNSTFVVYWCPESNGQPQGGTATAIKLAQQLRIPVFNLLHADVRTRIETRLQESTGPEPATAAGPKTS